MTTPKPKKEEKTLKEVETVKINKWDSSAVKHALDDAVKQALVEKPNCTEYFGLMDGRLFICGLAVIVALVALAWDFKYPFPQSKPVLVICVCTYFFLMGILTLYTSFKEKGIFAVAIQKDANGNKTWEASSDMKKYDDKYTLYLSVTNNKGERKAKMTKSCANYIDTNGVVLENLVANDVGRMFNSLCAEKKEK